MGIKYRAGADPRSLAIKLRIEGEGIRQEVEQIVAEVVDIGAKEQRQLLDRAVTRYGGERFARGRGRSAGRNDTGAMIDDVESSVASSKNRVTGRWGWVNGARDYYKYQDWGVGVPAAHSLLDSFMVVRAELQKRLRTMARR